MGLHPNPSPPSRPRKSEVAGSSRPACRAPASPPSRHTARTGSPPMKAPRTRECPLTGSGPPGTPLEAGRGRGRRARRGVPTHGPVSGAGARRWPGSSAPPWPVAGGRSPATLPGSSLPPGSPRPCSPTGWGRPPGTPPRRPGSESAGRRGFPRETPAKGMGSRMRGSGPMPARQPEDGRDLTSLALISGRLTRSPPTL